MTVVYMTHNGVQTILSMRHGITRAAQSQEWLDPDSHPDDEVVAKYAELGTDPGKGPNYLGFAEEIIQETTDGGGQLRTNHYLTADDNSVKTLRDMWTQLSQQGVTVPYELGLVVYAYEQTFDAAVEEATT